MSDFYTVVDEAVAELTEKKSRFIATIRPVADEEAANSFILEMKKKYWDARHNCSAYVVMEEKNLESTNECVFKTVEKANDDGEPSGTAGSPILKVIKGAELKKVAIVVTRYFGGILLGTGGLVRAYGGAAQLGVENSVKIRMSYLNRFKVITDYTTFGRLKNVAENIGAVIEDTEFTDCVTVTCLCDDAGFGAITARMNEATSGKCRIDLIEKNYFPWKDV